MARKNNTKWNQFKSPDVNNSDDGGDSWMMSYGDMMTLLLVFFVLIVSISEIDPVRMQLVTQSMRNALGESQFVPSLREVEQEMQQSIYDLNIEDMVSVERTKEGVQLLLQGESFFRSGDATLLPHTYEFLDEIAWQITTTPYIVSVEGHTDNLPISTRIYPSNWELSAARAASVVEYFETKNLTRDRFRVVGWSDTKPVDPILGNSTPEARRLNRRVVILFRNEFAPREALGSQWDDYNLDY